MTESEEDVRTRSRIAARLGLLSSQALGGASDGEPQGAPFFFPGRAEGNRHRGERDEITEL